MSTYTIKQIIQDNWLSFLDSTSNIRPVVAKEVSKMLHCQDPSLGHAFYWCDHCHNFKLVPFTCKSKFCNCCGIKYQHDRADLLASKLINCRHRHIVFTIPFELRNIFRQDRTLLHLLFQASSQTILDWFYSLNHSENFKPGIISSIHTFGRDLKWNPHIHMLVTEGASGNFTVWKSITFFPYVMLRKKWQTTLLFLLEKHLGKTKFRFLKNLLYHSNKDGFYVYAKPNLSSSYDVVNYIIRYIARPAMAQSRITHYDGSTVSFWYQRHEDNQRVEESIPVFDFIKRLIIHIHEPQFKTLRYYGLYAKKYLHHSKLIKRLKPSTIKTRKLLSRWRERIELSFGYDPCKCSCGKYMTFVHIFLPKKLASISS